MDLDLRKGFTKAKEVAYKAVDTVRDVGEKVSDVKDKALAAKDWVHDKWDSAWVDPKKALEDNKFLSFVQETYGNFDNMDLSVSGAATVKERYTTYKQATAATEELSTLFTEKLQRNFGEVPDDIKDSVDYHIRSLVLDSPESLRSYIRTIGKVKDSEQRIVAQEQIQAQFAKEGGKQGLQDRLETLKLANGFMARLFNRDKQKLARERVSREYGLSLAGLKEEIKTTKEKIRTQEQAEAEKNKIREKFKAERNAILRNSAVARDISDQVLRQVDQKIREYLGSEQVSQREKAQELGQKLYEPSLVEGEFSFAPDGQTVEETREAYQEVMKTMNEIIEEGAANVIRATFNRSTAQNIDTNLLEDLKRGRLGSLVGKQARQQLRLVVDKVRKEPGIDPIKAARAKIVLDTSKYLALAA